VVIEKLALLRNAIVHCHTQFAEQPDLLEHDFAVHPEPDRRRRAWTLTRGKIGVERGLRARLTIIPRAVAGGWRGSGLPPVRILFAVP
jgi:hypothetical protein